MKYKLMLLLILIVGINPSFAATHSADVTNSDIAYPNKIVSKSYSYYKGKKEAYVQTNVFKTADDPYAYIIHAVFAGYCEKDGQKWACGGTGVDALFSVGWKGYRWGKTSCSFSWGCPYFKDGHVHVTALRVPKEGTPEVVYNETIKIEDMNNNDI